MKIEISSKHFLNRSYGNNSQYSKIYQDRLSQFRPILRDNLKSKFGNCQYEFVEQIPDLSSEKNKVQMLIGIIFKKMHKRPNVFQEIYADNDEIVDDLYKSEAKKEKIERSQDLPVFGEKENKTTTNFYECYISQEDTVYLEDEIQRIKIKFKNNEQNFLTTGCCVGICGRNVGGTLEIDNYIFPIRNQIERRLFQTKDKILFLSTLADVTFDKNELDIDEMKTNLNETILNSFHLLIDDIKYQKILFNDIKSLILIGNILPSFSHDVYKKHRLVNCSVGNRLENLPNNQLKIERLDKILFKLLENLSIYIVPGANDPTTYILPQQPISKIFFPRCKDHHNFHSITSPSILNLIEENDEGKLKLLISNGRVINDCMKQTTFPKPIDAMEYLLKTSHLCPMAPDSIPMVPFEKDPFQLRDIPDIFICGNQPIYEHKSFQNSSYRSELISIPSFINKFQSIILDLKSMTSQKFSLERM
ncbi:hypothetical protein SNEBB_009101 [Seison nebaliae]|nr:hypothetical protein SNEBB_009101 [Seison nebaliae]